MSAASKNVAKNSKSLTPHQKQVYTYLLAIPRGRIATYAKLAKDLNSSPRAVGGALRSNPYAPRVPCHRVISATGHIGGFKGDWEAAPSGVNQTLKRKLLKEEGVEFDTSGKLLTTSALLKSPPKPETWSKAEEELVRIEEGLDEE